MLENKNIAKKLVKVMSECSHVIKNGQNDYHNYKYATAEDVLQKVNASLTKYNIASIVSPTLESMLEVLNRNEKKEKTDFPYSFTSSCIIITHFFKKCNRFSIINL